MVRETAQAVRWRYALAVLVTMTMASTIALLIAAPAAFAKVHPTEVKAYSEGIGVSAEIAEERLTIQHRGLDLAPELEDVLGEDYAGVWFDNNAGEYVIPLLKSSDRQAIATKLADKQLHGAYRLTPARLTWQELEAAQDRLNAALQALGKRDEVQPRGLQTSLDPERNMVTVETAPWLSGEEESKVTRLARDVGPVSPPRPGPSAQFRASPLICGEENCSRPLRGGVSLNNPSANCTAGFLTRGDANGKRYVLTAGHCVATPNPRWEWYAYDLGAGIEEKVGLAEQWHYPGNDWAKINATGGYWDTPPWSSLIVHWGGRDPERPTPWAEYAINEAYPITGEAASVVGNLACHSGITTGTTCGFIHKKNVSKNYGGGWVNGLVEMGGQPEDKELCADEGDSGGPVFAGNKALGLLSSGSALVICWAGEGWGGPYVWYTEIGKATSALGVHLPTIDDNKPVGTTTEATNVSWNQATGNGIVEPNGLPTTYHFQWGTTTSYGNTSASGSAGSGWNATAVSAKLGYLVPGTTYHYRLVTTNSAGTSYGPDKVFYSSRAGVFFSDANSSNSTTRWGWDTGKGWQQEPLYGHAMAPGTKPATMMFNGTPHVFYVDAANGNTITDWTWNPTSGWHQVPLWGNKVAPGTSPAALVVNGVPHVFFVDANNNNRITAWRLNPSTGWQQFPLFGNQVAAGTSPSAIMFGNEAHVFYVDASNGNTITDWNLKPATGWKQIFFYGHKVAAATSPTAIVNTCCVAQYGAMPQVYFVDATNNNSISGWTWHSSNGWQQAFLYGHPVAAGTSPDAMMNNNTPHIAFVDASNNNTITDWTWSSSTGWQQSFLWGHPVAADTSPEAVSDNNIPNIYFVDASNGNTITDWTLSPTTGWQQVPFGGNSLSAKSSPGAF
jgi:hypothetical protein